MFLFLWWKLYHLVILLCLLWSSEGLTLASSFFNPTEEGLYTHLKFPSTFTTVAYSTPSLDSSKTETPSLHSYSSSIQSLGYLSSNTISLKSLDITSGLISTSILSSTENIDINSSFHPSVTVINSFFEYSNSVIRVSPDSNNKNIIPSSFFIKNEASQPTSSYSISSKLEIPPSNFEVNESDSFSHFHTPLMSLLLATPSSSWQTSETTFTTLHQFNNPAHSLTTSSSDNELSNLNHLSVPADQDHKKLLILVLKAEDCSKFSKTDFEKMLSKLMAKFGFNDVIPEVSNAKCYSHLNINVTVGGPIPTLRFLPNIDGKNNFTVDVLNRTFRIVKLEKVDFKLEKTKSSNVTSNIIAAVAKHESVAYIAVGVSFGIILVICVSVCCIKCCCLRKPQKRYGVPKGTHVRLRPEDYTLTPIPRPTSLYVDYYRGSGTADIYSTTSAGSIASTTPTVEQGVVQPFDTSIVPLEDSANLPVDSSRDPSVESVPVQSDLKTFNIHSLSGKGFRTVSTDSKEQLNPKACTKRVEIKPSGVANPTFQRY